MVLSLFNVFSCYARHWLALTVGGAVLPHSHSYLTHCLCNCISAVHTCLDRGNKVQLVEAADRMTSFVVPCDECDSDLPGHKIPIDLLPAYLACAYVRTHVHTYVHTCVCVCVCVCVCTDTQAYRHTDIQTYRHTNAQTYKRTHTVQFACILYSTYSELYAVGGTRCDAGAAA